MKRCLLALLLIALPSCGQTPTEFRPLPAALGDLRGLALGFQGLLALTPEEGIYAAWVNLDRGEVIGLGGFQVNAAGRPIDDNGAVIDRFTSTQNLFKAVSVLITIEVTGTVGSAPSAAVMLQGPLIDGVANLRVPAPLGIDQASGSYRVFTPTDGPGTNEGSGLWGVGVDDTALLDLPPLNAVYAYEHYLEINGQTLTLGRFTNPALPDFANPHSGADPAPAFPGEDFLVNPPAGVVFPADLAGTRVLITLEPVLDDSADPSQLVILDAILPAGLVGEEIIDLTNQVVGFPTGTAVIF